MKFKIYKLKTRFALTVTILALLSLPGSMALAQDDSSAVKSEAPVVQKAKPVKNTFQSVWIIENQTVMVPIKKTFEMDIMHRFGLWNKGYEDFWGFFAPSNIRLGFSYVPINKLNVGIGVTKTTMATIPYAEKPSSVAGPMWDASVKYSIITQTKGKYPVSVTYYGNVGYNTKKDPNKEIYLNYSDRLSYFNQLIIARKINDKLSVQIAPSHAHQNLVNGYFVKLDSATLKAKPEMAHDQFSISLAARYKLTQVTSLIMNYDQPITKHVKNNPNPNFSFGMEFNTSSHSFQVFFTSYQFLVPQINSLYNNNNPMNHKVEADGGYPFSPEFLIGFNITRLWNY
jgi:hypothetical protein